MRKNLLLLVFLASCTTTEVRNLSKQSTPADVMIPVTENDVKVISRASDILADATKWNRRDNRECPLNAITYSLYCALFKASVDVNGVFDHRLAALEETRRTVESESKGKNYEHRLMGFNNDPTTQFEDIKRVLKTTQSRLEMRLGEGT